MTLVLSFIVICCFQFCAKVIVWIIILVSLILIFIVGGIALYFGIRHCKDVLETDKTSGYILIGFGAALLLVGIILLLIIIALRKRISLGSALVQEASRMIKNNICLLLVPIIYAIIFAIGTVLIVITMVFYFSSLEMKGDDYSREIVFKKNDRLVVIYSVLCFFWLLFFIIGMTQYTIAGAGALFYFSRSSSDRKYFPIASTLWTLVWHHLGSIAVGSFLIALVCTFRAIVLYMSKKAKASKNETLRCILSCLQCCLGCLQKLLEFISCRAYILMAIEGKNFWYSAFDAIKLLLSNPIRSLFITAISKFLIVCGELLVCAITTITCFIILRPDVFSADGKSPIHVVYWWFIAFLCAIISILITWIFFQVYDYLIDTAYMCFLKDEEMEMKYRNDYLTYASDDLRSFMDVVDENAKDIENGGDGNFRNDRKDTPIIKISV